MEAFYTAQIGAAAPKNQKKRFVQKSVMRDPHYRTCFGVSSPGVPFNSGVANQRPLFVLPHSIFVVALLIAGSMAPLPASLIMKLRHERIDASEGHSSFARLTVNKHSFGTSKH